MSKIIWGAIQIAIIIGSVYAEVSLPMNGGSPQAGMALTAGIFLAYMVTAFSFFMWDGIRNFSFFLVRCFRFLQARIGKPNGNIGWSAP